jgi:hypothetical protein
MDESPQLQARVNVNITVNFMPFGEPRTQEPLDLMNKQPELSPEPAGQATPSGEFLFPERTAISPLIPSPGPMILITR